MKKKIESLKSKLNDPVFKENAKRVATVVVAGVAVVVVVKYGTPYVNATHNWIFGTNNLGTLKPTHKTRLANGDIATQYRSLPHMFHK